MNSITETTEPIQLVSISKASQNGLNKFAKSFAKSLSNAEFKTFNEGELKKEWGGDLQYLVHAKMNSKISANKNFNDVLLENQLDNESKNEIVTTQSVRILATENSFNKLKEKGYKDILIVVEPPNEKAETLDAYTITGELVKISAKTEPVNPVLIVGLCEICDENEAKKLILPTKKTGSQRRTNGYREVLTYIRLPNLQSVESWWDGKPEMKVLGFCYNSNMITLQKVIDSPLGSTGSLWNREKWEAGINLASPTYFGVGYEMFYWSFTEHHSPSYILKIWEQDSDGSVLALSFTSNGVTVNYTGIKSGDDQLDERQISYSDPSPKTINNGVITFTLENKP